QVVRLRERGFEPAQRAMQAAQRTFASLRRHGCANSIVERDETHTVAARRRHVAEHERRREHMLETWVASGELRHRAAAIDERDDRLRAFDRLLAADQTAVARRR